LWSLFPNPSLFGGIAKILALQIVLVIGSKRWM